MVRLKKKGKCNTVNKTEKANLTGIRRSCKEAQFFKEPREYKMENKIKLK
jgi:hypothetical protein